jgi:hypothetical protein
MQAFVELHDSDLNAPELAVTLGEGSMAHED